MTPIVPYEGSIRYRGKHTPPEVSRAYACYCGMKARSKKAGFPPPEMTAHEFVGWWLEQIKTFSGKVPSVSRLDHSRGYSWDNFRMDPKSENSRESGSRNKQKMRQRLGKRVFIFRDDGIFTGIIPTISDTARFFGVSQRMIQLVLSGRRKPGKNIGFSLRLEA